MPGELFDVLGFEWDRSAANAPVDSTSTAEAIATFKKGIAGHVWAAAALEGNPFTYPEVQTLIEGITVGGHKLSDERQVLNLRDGYELLRGMLQEQIFNLDKATSDALHDAIMKNDALESGHFRAEGSATSSVTVNLGERGTHHPPETEAGGNNLVELFSSGTAVLMKEAGSVFELAAAYFLFAADCQFYFDGNKRTGRAMMNGLLMAAGIDAVLVPGTARQEFNVKMSDFYASRDGTQMMSLLRAYGPVNPEPTSTKRPGKQDPNWKF